MDIAVEEFHQMRRREHIKPRGLVARSWLDWEAGSRPNWDYQDLLSRLFNTSPVHLAGPRTTPPPSPRGPQDPRLRPSEIIWRRNDRGQGACRQ
jgi:hypothetical protein